MSHFEERLEKDLQAIRESITTLGGYLRQAIGSAVEALLTSDRRLANETILRDQIVNRQVQRLDSLCHSFVVRHSPSAGHLRFISSTLRISVSLERVGDYVVAVCREAARLSGQPKGVIRRDIDALVAEAQNLLDQSLDAFTTQNADLAKGVGKAASNVGHAFDDAFEDLVAQGDAGACCVADLLAYLMVFSRLSRICDQSKNICEETVFVVTGEQKPPKRFRILFVDAANDGWSQMAQLIAERIFGDSARISSAGWSPAGGLDPGVADFMEVRGFTPDACAVRRLEPLPEILKDHHLVIGLEPEAETRLGRIPHHTVFLAWDPGPSPVSLLTHDQLETGFQRLTAAIGALAEVLTGRRGAED